MNLAVEKDGVGQIGDFAIEPEVHAADGPVLESIDFAREFFSVRCGRHVRQQLLHRFEGQRDDEEFRNERAGAGVDGPLRNFFVPLGRFDVGVEMELRSLILQELRSAGIQFAEGDGTHAHRCRLRRSS